jgi:hypothetical protein
MFLRNRRLLVASPSLSLSRSLGAVGGLLTALFGKAGQLLQLGCALLVKLLRFDDDGVVSDGFTKLTEICSGVYPFD